MELIPLMFKEILNPDFKTNIGVHVKDLSFNKHGSDTDYLMELYRSDWSDHNCKAHDIKQIVMVERKPGDIHAWHRHLRGQVDYLFVVSGKIKFCVYDPKQHNLVEKIIDSNSLSLYRIPGHLWHGYKVLGKTPAKILYFVNKLYDYNNPDEERMDFNDLSVKPVRVNNLIFKGRWMW